MTSSVFSAEGFLSFNFQELILEFTKEVGGDTGEAKTRALETQE